MLSLFLILQDRLEILALKQKEAEEQSRAKEEIWKVRTLSLIVIISFYSTSRSWLLCMSFQLLVGLQSSSSSSLLLQVRLEEAERHLKDILTRIRYPIVFASWRHLAALLVFLVFWPFAAHSFWLNIGRKVAASVFNFLDFALNGGRSRTNLLADSPPPK